MHIRAPSAAAWTLILLGLLGLIIAIPAMAHRLDARDTPLVWFQPPIQGQQFSFLGEPVRIDVREPTVAAETPMVTVDFRGRRLEFPIEPGMRNDARLPGLKRFDGWLRLAPMITGASTETEVKSGLASGALEPRLLIAIRRPAAGYDPESWGLVRRKDWRYQFALLSASGPVEECVELVESTYAELDELGDPEFREREGRQDEAWKFQAMLQVTPATAYRRKNRPLDGAMDAMGWTWPIGGLSTLAVVLGCATLSLSGRRSP